MMFLGEQPIYTLFVAAGSLVLAALALTLVPAKGEFIPQAE